MLFSKLTSSYIGWFMIGAFIIFVIIFMAAFIEKFKNFACVALKFAPSVMTALGLLGTFLELTHVLKLLDAGGGAVNFDSGTVQTFVENLGVFLYILLQVLVALSFL